MRSMGILGVATILVVPAGVSHAQAPQGGANAESRITVTGCLQMAPATPIGTSGSTSSTAEGQTSYRFALVNARIGGAPGGGSAVTSIAPPGSGTNESATRAGSTRPSAAIIGAGPAADVDNSKMFLIRGEDAQLTRHLGQEVEISGHPDNSSTSASAGTEKREMPRRVEAQTLRMIASVCAVP